MYRILKIGIPLLASLLFSGCFSADLMLRVNPDGSGVLVEMSNLPANASDARKLLEQFKGIKVSLEPEIRIEFSK